MITAVETRRCLTVGCSLYSKPRKKMQSWFLIQRRDAEAKLASCSYCPGSNQTNS
jgi:hypothetical protein